MAPSLGNTHWAAVCLTDVHLHLNEMKERSQKHFSFNHTATQNLSFNETGSSTEIPGVLSYLPSFLLSLSPLLLLLFLLQVPTLHPVKALRWWWPSIPVVVVRGWGRFWRIGDNRWCWASRRRPTPSWGSFVPTWRSWRAAACSEPRGTPPPTCTCCSTPGAQVWTRLLTSYCLLVVERFIVGLQRAELPSCQLGRSLWGCFKGFKKWNEGFYLYFVYNVHIHV